MDTPGAVSSIPSIEIDPRPVMLDLHVLLTDRVNESWAEKCLNSIVVAAARAPFRTELHLEDEIVGDFWAARRRGYSVGDAPYVANVDVDDWLHPDALWALHDGMLAGAGAVTTSGVLVDVNTRHHKNTQTGLLAFKRELLDQVDWTNPARHCCPEHALLRSGMKPHRYPEPLKFMRVGYRSLCTPIREETARGLG